MRELHGGKLNENPVKTNDIEFSLILTEKLNKVNDALQTLKAEKKKVTAWVERLGTWHLALAGESATDAGNGYLEYISKTKKRFLKKKQKLEDREDIDSERLTNSLDRLKNAVKQWKKTRKPFNKALHEKKRSNDETPDAPLPKLCRGTHQKRPSNRSDDKES